MLAIILLVTVARKLIRWVPFTSLRALKEHVPIAANFRRRPVTSFPLANDTLLDRP
jgi:hypothetical protein